MSACQTGPFIPGGGSPASVQFAYSQAGRAGRGRARVVAVPGGANGACILRAAAHATGQTSSSVPGVSLARRRSVKHTKAKRALDEGRSSSVPVGPLI